MPQHYRSRENLTRKIRTERSIVNWCQPNRQGIVRLDCYDDFGNLRTVKDPRTQLETTVTYSPAGQLLSVIHPGPEGPIATSYGYYPSDHANAGRLHWEQDGRGKRKYFGYNTIGQLTHEWGATTYPLRHVFDQYGDRHQLHTYREGHPSLWDGPVLPGTFDHFDFDTTTWNYDPGSGLLLSKKDAGGKGPTYTYYDSGLVETRTWQRGVVTTYTHTAAGQLQGTSYSDGTPSTGRTYRRDGSLATITDAAGTTTFVHGNPGGQASEEDVAGGLLDGLHLEYPSLNGRRESFKAEINGTTLSDVDYGWSPIGRLASVTDLGIGVSSTYGYVPNSDLIETITSTSGNGTVLTGIRTYDSANRLDLIRYQGQNGADVTLHDYTYDSAHRRTRADRENSEAWAYGYNDRGEVTAARKQLADGSPIAGWQQEFDHGRKANFDNTFKLNRLRSK